MYKWESEFFVYFHIYFLKIYVNVHEIFLKYLRTVIEIINIKDTKEEKSDFNI